MKKIKILTTLTILITLLFSNVIYADSTVYTDGPLLYVIEDNGEITIVEYFGREDSVRIPMAIGEHTVTGIADNAFKDGDVKSVELPNTIKHLGNNAFGSNVQVTKLDAKDYYDDVEVIEDETQKEDEEIIPKEDSQENNPEIKEEQTQEQKQDNSIEQEINNDNAFSEVVVDLTEDFEEAEKEELYESQTNIDVNGEDNINVKTDNYNAILNNSDSTLYIVIAIVIIVGIAVIKNRRKKQ